jgi:transposase InsO family protein
MIGISPSTYYYRPKQSRTERDKADADLCDKIDYLQAEYSAWGYRTLKEQLLLQYDMNINGKRILRIMHRHGLFRKIKKKFIRTTDSNHQYPVYPNLLKNPELEITGINQVWVADITYIRILTGFVFLAVILDIYSRRVIGWALSKSIDHYLTLAALRMALKNRKPGKDVIHHSDRGVQYACHEYTEVLTANYFKISMSAKGNPYDNAYAESFFKTLKNEEVYLWEYESFIDVIERIPQFIEDVYNRKRVHSGIKYLPPAEYEAILNDEKRKHLIGQITLKLPR